MGVRGSERGRERERGKERGQVDQESAWPKASLYRNEELWEGKQSPWAGDFKVGAR